MLDAPTIEELLQEPPPPINFSSLGVPNQFAEPRVARRWDGPDRESHLRASHSVALGQPEPEKWDEKPSLVGRTARRSCGTATEVTLIRMRPRAVPVLAPDVGKPAALASIARRTCRSGLGFELNGADHTIDAWGIRAGGIVFDTDLDRLLRPARQVHGFATLSVHQ